MDAAPLVFAYRQHALRIWVIDAVAWYDLADLCALLGRPSVDDAIAFVGSIHPQRLHRRINATQWIDEDGLWSVVSLAGYHFADDLARWLHGEVAPKVRRAVYEQAPNGNLVEVRELWHVIDHLLEIDEAKDYGHGTGTLAINLVDTQLAAFRRGLRLPSKATLSRLLARSKIPLYRGPIRITHGGREIPCLAFERA